MIIRVVFSLILAAQLLLAIEAMVSGDRLAAYAGLLLAGQGLILWRQ